MSDWIRWDAKKEKPSSSKKVGDYDYHYTNTTADSISSGEREITGGLRLICD